MPRPQPAFPDTRGYDDYRLFLTDAMSARWGQNGDGAVQALAQAAGCVVGQLVNVLSGRRHLQGEALDGMIRALNLQGEQRSAFTLLVRRAEPMSGAAATDLELRLFEIRRAWLAEREAEVARSPSPPQVQHPAVHRFYQGPQSDAPLEPVVAGLRESLESIDQRGPLLREFQGLTWTVPASAVSTLIELMGTLAAEAEALLHSGAAEARGDDRRYLWQAQVFPLTAPVHLTASDPAPITPSAPVVCEPTPDGAPPNVWDYIDVHLYLQAWTAWKKAQVPGWSVGRMALKLGIIPSYLYQVVAGTRCPAGEQAQAIADFVAPEPDDNLHFLRLCRLAREHSLLAAAELWWEVVEVLAERGHRPPDAVCAALISLPELMCLHLAPDLAGFCEDVRWLAACTGLSARRIALAVRFLEQTGLWERDAQGRVYSARPRGRGTGLSQAHGQRLLRQYQVRARDAVARPHRNQGFWRVEGPLSKAAAQELVALVQRGARTLAAACAALEAAGASGAGPRPDMVVRLQIAVHPQVIPPQPRRKRVRTKKGS